MRPTIWKFPVMVGEFSHVVSAEGALVMHVGLDGQQNPSMWLGIDTEHGGHVHKFYGAMTGEDVSERQKLTYLGSVLLSDGTMLHVFSDGGIAVRAT